MRKTKEEADKTRKEIIEAARRVFHRCGVSRSTLEKIAQEAGVTRGAVYWHFKNKAEVFFAMREDVIEPMIARADGILLSDLFDDPLDAIEASIKEFFRLLNDSRVVREVFEIMLLRCEYVEEFTSVQEEVNRPGCFFLARLKHMYQLAVGKQRLRASLDPALAAKDTWAFTSGLLHLLLNAPKDSYLDLQVCNMIHGHMVLRRP